MTTVAWVPGRPSPQGSMRAFNSRVVQGGSPASRQRLTLWRKAVAEELARRHKGGPYTGPCGVSVTFAFDVPASRRKGAIEQQPRSVAPDLDKLVRAVLDAATAARVWLDDAQVAQLIANKTEVLSGEPGAIIHIWELP